MKFFSKKNVLVLLNIFVILVLIFIPYALFKGKYFIGGDDTRLFYVFPIEYLKNTQFFSWVNLSSIGWNYPNQDFLPFVLIWSLVFEIVRTRVIIDYLAFSLPLILGFIFFQVLIRELVIEKADEYKIEIFLGAVFYIFSPILIQNHYLNPLIPIWLIGLIPAVVAFFLRFLKTGKAINILLAIIFVTIFSFGFHNIPWAAGFLLPILISLFVCSFLFSLRQIMHFIKMILIFSAILLLSQSFWIFAFLPTFVGPGSSSLTSKIATGGFSNEFARAIEATAKGMVIYPLLDLYHRQIAFDFNWNLKEIFLNYYDRTYALGLVYIGVIFLGIRNFKKNTNGTERKIFLILLVAFGLSLYFFTINIGPLFNLFITFGQIPGFVLFRNAYDKFALGYSLIYSLLLVYCLIIIHRKFSNKGKKYLIIISLLVITIVVNGFPFKDIVTSPLWTTKNIHQDITIPNEYLNFMSDIESNVSSTNNILSVPYGLSLYSVIKDTDTDNVYVGVSPVGIFSGVNDISGFLSFNYHSDGDVMNKAITNKNYQQINKILYDYNINYVMVTNNVPQEVRKSFIYVQDVLASQDAAFLKNITDKKILTSSKKNYELYTTKKRNSLLFSENLKFRKINRVEYQLEISGIKKNQVLIFNDSFHPGWQLFLRPIKNKFDCLDPINFKDLKTIECKTYISIFKLSDLSYLFTSSLFDRSHSNYNNFGNKWEIDPSYIKKNVDSKFYTLNPDGSINIQMDLYFVPQEFFYIGTMVSILTLLVLIMAVSIKKK